MKGEGYEPSAKGTCDLSRGEPGIDAAIKARDRSGREGVDAEDGAARQPGLHRPRVDCEANGIGLHAMS